MRIKYGAKNIETGDAKIARAAGIYQDCVRNEENSSINQQYRAVSNKKTFLENMKLRAIKICGKFGEINSIISLW